MAVDIFTDDRRLFIYKGLPVDYIEFKHYIIVSLEYFRKAVYEEAV